MKDIYSIITGVHVSEKSSLLQEKGNQYVFKVAKSATKTQIKLAVKALFDKDVASVQTSHCLGKERRKRRADAGRTSHWKKAVVRLKEGQSIDII